jgi:hypothetical protein
MPVSWTDTFRGTASRLTGRAWLAVGLAVLLAAPAAVPSLAQAADEQSRLEELEREVRQLRQELKAAGGAGAGARIDELERKLEVLAEELQRLRGREVEAVAGTDETGIVPGGMAPAVSKVYRQERGVSVGGYGEVLYQSFDDTNEAGDPSGKTDELDMKRLITYFGYKFNDWILFNSEIEYEHANTSAEGEVEVELAYLDFLLNPRFNVRAGMFLVPVGFINELHEPPIFLGARRPLVERNIIPTTWAEVGVGVYGESGRVTYRGYLGSSLDAAGFSSSSGLRGGRQKGSKARAEDLALTGRVDVDVAPGLLVGGSLFTGGTGQGRSATTGGQAIDGTVTMWDLHAEYRNRGWQARALWVDVDLDDAALISDLVGETVGSAMEGYYVEAGYDVLAARGTDHELIPYVRIESYDTLAELPTGSAGAGRETDVTTIGVAYKPIPQVVIKADHQSLDNETDTAVDQWNVALGFLF